MWKNFSIDEYAPREHKKPNVRAMSAPPVKKSKPRTPRITIPEPFYMTLREELKKPTKTKGWSWSLPDFHSIHTVIQIQIQK